MRTLQKLSEIEDRAEGDYGLATISWSKRARESRGRCDTSPRWSAVSR